MEITIQSDMPPNWQTNSGLARILKSALYCRHIDKFARAVANNEGYNGSWAGSTDTNIGSQTDTPGVGTLPQNNIVPPPAPATSTQASPQSFGQQANNAVVGFGTAMGNFGQGILSPFARLGVSGYNAIAAPIAGIGAALNGGNSLQAFNQQASAPRNIGFSGGPVAPYLPTSQPSGAPLTNEQTVRQGLSAAGGAAQIGANFIGGGGASGLAEDAAKQTIGATAYQGAKTGLLSGGLFGLGLGLQDPNATPGSVAGQTAIGAGIGGVGGGLLGAGLGAAQNAAQGPESDAWETIQPKGKNVSPESLQIKNTATGSVAVSVPTDDYDQKMIQAVLPYKPDPGDPIGSWQRITQGAHAQTVALRNSLDPEQGIWSPKNYQSVLDKVPVPIGAKGEASASAVNGVKDFVMSLTDDADKHTVGTLDVSRQFRAGIN